MPAPTSPPTPHIRVGVGAAALVAASCAAHVAAATLSTLPTMSVLRSAFAGAGVDVGIALVLAAAGRGTSRVAPARALRVLVDVLGGLVAVLICASAAARVQLGTALTRPMLAYAADVRVGNLEPRALATLAACAVLALGAGGFAWARPRTLSARQATGLAALTCVALALGADPGDPWARSGSAAVAFLASVPPTTRTSIETPPAPFDAPSTRMSPNTPAAVDAATHVALPVASTTQRRPHHLVVWLAESTGARHTSLYGGPALATPQLAALRDHSLRVATFRAPAPVSIRALFSLLCGDYGAPESTLESRSFPRIACQSLPELLHAQGYRSGFFHGGYFAFTDKLAFLAERGFDRLVDGENVPERARYWSNGWGVDDAAVVDEGLRFVAAEAPRAPTFAMFVPLLPHYEYFLPPSALHPFGDADLAARHMNGVAYSDALFGRVVERYKALGIFDDTLFVYLGDHGEAFAEHPGNTLHGTRLYEENLRAPLVFASSRLFEHERVSERAGSHIDVKNTVLDLLGLPTDPAAQGQSLVAEGWTPRPTLLTVSVPSERLGVVDGPYKLIRASASGAEELYNLGNDPDERNNLAASQPEIAKELRARLVDFQARQRSTLQARGTLGTGYLRRAFDRLTVAHGPANGAAAPCERKADAWWCTRTKSLEFVHDRVFNMETECLRATLTEGEQLVLDGVLDAPLRTVGIGLTDGARQRRGTPLDATFFVGDAPPVRIHVNDVFETTSARRTLDAEAPAGTALHIVLQSAHAKNRVACVALSP